MKKWPPASGHYFRMHGVFESATFIAGYCGLLPPKPSAETPFIVMYGVFGFPF